MNEIREIWQELPTSARVLVVAILAVLLLLVFI